MTGNWKVLAIFLLIAVTIMFRIGRKIAIADAAAFEVLWPHLSTFNAKPKDIIAEIPKWRHWAKSQPLIVRFVYWENLAYFRFAANEEIKDKRKSKRIKAIAKSFPRMP